jgi:FAD-linked sulfhydryl oxidase
MYTKKRNKHKKVFTRKHYSSDDGMLTSVWGPCVWVFLHILSFNYPTHPSTEQKLHYKQFIKSLQHVLPCVHCRNNLKKNFKKFPITDAHMKNRTTFSKYVYQLHEYVNKMLGKKSGLTFAQVRDKYEHFRSRCTTLKKSNKKERKTTKKHKGCVDPLYGTKSKCVINIVPKSTPCPTLKINKQCLKKRIEP